MSPGEYDAVIVGAGFAGIGAAIQLKRMGIENFVILDREDDLGGTWYVNHYPGLAVDVPTTTYSYFFEPNPNWSRLFSTGAEIKQYADDVADKYDVRRHIRLSTTVEGARWDEETSLWRVALAGGEALSARYLFTATGFLSQPRTPDIPGITDFAGEVIHTTDWDDSYRPEGRRIAIIGTGATAVQLIPELAEKAADLTVYQRTPIWVVPKIDLKFSARAKALFARVPLTQRAVRAVTDGIYAFMVDTAVLKHRYFRRFNIAAADLAKLHRFASIRDPELRRKLTPDYDFGCKRPTFSNGYYRTFTKPHVHLQADGIERVEADGIVNADGTKTAIDTLVLATGFDLWEANFPAIEVIGREGRNLGKWWRETRFQAYQGVSMPYFPNYLSLASPYAFLGLNFFNTMEYQMHFMDRLFGEVKRRKAMTFEVTEEANTRYLDRMTEALGDSLFTLGNCASARSYYFNPSGEATLLRPMTTRRAVTEASRFPLSDYTFA
ncbi:MULTISPECIES: NAD(P)/FAD-dependent oxidoreductase [unclassified Mycolicibacterium]|uniref:flavin-containing monooxygenase n=1 Tax=unclassified Mycolicibacterium TaxID=2636767 RepID=UPI0012DD4654|nr:MULTISPECIES: NAD(P)/FAD-dependent oxidoreductase [unclassified Mycolicibacterium]MUL81856.1 NAD(P)/FAD-dependent oxidoreductase [Mycolicibacterium sp. CBMA 329]MUL87622.1 NAD(P)/FAD-dependent oxidoreductase [Mycolicibacterium sp. CBMA 331]MUL99514.1 NAD(P)/FAD-dependent oxidoreductase [Mycolicibacterium sp. CBMA 334]MUM26400.1 NAD(P)/FAD-dependent oxidoreductase [Mycolicibacterium sp. CBMA 295]MUM37919.1 NAD(P)/FAD-dependent oxidoreductase [Mycolicibacterium sp. CBMA 247]